TASSPSYSPSSQSTSSAAALNATTVVKAIVVSATPALAVMGERASSQAAPGKADVESSSVLAGRQSEGKSDKHGSSDSISLNQDPFEDDSLYSPEDSDPVSPSSSSSSCSSSSTAT